MNAMVEALSFLGPRGLVARDSNSCIHYDSKHAAGVCLGTIQARTHVQFARACQQSMLSVQHRLRLPCNTCTATAGTWRMNVLIMPPHLGHSALSYHKLATRWVRHKIDTFPCFDACNNIGDVLGNCVTLVLTQHGLSPFSVRSFLQCFVVPSVKPWNPVSFHHLEFWRKFRSEHVESSNGAVN